MAQYHHPSEISIGIEEGVTNGLGYKNNTVSSRNDSEETLQDHLLDISCSDVKLNHDINRSLEQCCRLRYPVDPSRMHLFFKGSSKLPYF